MFFLYFIYSLLLVKWSLKWLLTGNEIKYQFYYRKIVFNWGKHLAEDLDTRRLMLDSIAALTYVIFYVFWEEQNKIKMISWKYTSIAI